MVAVYVPVLDFSWKNWKVCLFENWNDENMLWFEVNKCQ
jgi:hypothetical protein